MFHSACGSRSNYLYNNNNNRVIYIRGGIEFVSNICMHGTHVGTQTRIRGRILLFFLSHIYMMMCNPFMRPLKH